jgi:hypothetical protein
MQGGFEIGTLVLVFVGWFALNRWILPKAGIPT